VPLFQSGGATRLSGIPSLWVNGSGEDRKRGACGIPEIALSNRGNTTSNRAAVLNVPVAAGGSLLGTPKNG
jgi:hypothetical protein